MPIDFSKWNSQIDHKQFNEQMKKASNKEFKPLPDGLYKCRLVDLKLEEKSKDDDRPTTKAVFEITDGEYKGRKLFWSKVMIGTKADGWMISMCKDLVRQLAILDDIAVDFFDFNDWDNVLCDVKEGADEEHAIYSVKVGHSEWKGKTYNDIKEVERI